MTQRRSRGKHGLCRDLNANPQVQVQIRAKRL
jgi:hypothetical protein